MNNTQKGDRLKIVPQGEQEEPEVYGITKGKQGVKLGRRAFLGTLGAGVLASTGGCSPGVKNCNAPLIDAGETEHTEQQRCDTLKAHSGRLAGVFISPDNTLMISASWDKTIKLWSLPEGKLLKTFEGHSDCVDCLALSSDGTLLVSGSRDKTLKLWSLPEGTLLHTFEHSDWVIAVAISPDGTLIAVGASELGAGEISLWTLPEGEPNWCVFDPAITKAGTTVREYRQMSSETVCVCDTIQVQAWSSLPGSTCVCDTVQVGSYTPPPPGSSGGGGHYWHPN